MLRFDGTGPMGIESLTGRGLGRCAGYSPRSGIGFGRGHGRGFGRCFPFGFALDRKSLQKCRMNY